MNDGWDDMMTDLFGRAAQALAKELDREFELRAHYGDRVRSDYLEIPRGILGDA